MRGGEAITGVEPCGSCRVPAALKYEFEWMITSSCMRRVNGSRPLQILEDLLTVCEAWFRPDAVQVGWTWLRARSSNVVELKDEKPAADEGEIEEKRRLKWRI